MNKQRKPWAWVPTLYFAEGLPYVAVMTISLIMYKRLGLSNTDITLYTSWLYLPWVIKPLWSPFIDIIKTKRWWIVTMQLLIGAALGGVAFTIPAPYWLQGSLAFFWLMAFASATHDIAADGFYMLGLKEHDQAYFVGIRSTFYRIATIVGQGLLVMLAGNLEVVMEHHVLRHGRPLYRILAVAPLYPATPFGRQGHRENDRQSYPAGVLVYAQDLLPEASGMGRHLLHALLPHAGGTAGQGECLVPD